MFINKGIYDKIKDVIKPCVLDDIILYKIYG